jgi:histidine decarboxylase
MRLEEVLWRIGARVKAARRVAIGFPVAVDIEYERVLSRYDLLLNNIGDPYTDGAYLLQTKQLERELVEYLADLFRAPEHDRWGYVTSGGTEGNLYALFLARTLYPDAVVYHSDASHYSVPKAIRLLNMPVVKIRATMTGEINYEELHEALAANRERPAVVLANIGTTMTEAIDDVSAIGDTLRDAGVEQHYIHADAALSGVPLALEPPGVRPRLDFADGADSVSVSGHKFFGTPIPCGVVMTRRSLHDQGGERVAYYTGSPDTTVTGSRSGHAALLMWYAVNLCGTEGLRDRAVRSRELAAYATARLDSIGWEAWRHPYAFTVAMKTPPAAVLDRWALATDAGFSHIICMPGVTVEQVDAFVHDLAQSQDQPRSGEAAGSVLGHELGASAGRHAMPEVPY